MSPDDLLTITQAAQALKQPVSRATMYRWVREDRIPTVLVAGRRLVRRGDLKRAPRPTATGARRAADSANP